LEELSELCSFIKKTELQSPDCEFITTVLASFVKEAESSWVIKDHIVVFTGHDVTKKIDITKVVKMTCLIKLINSLFSPGIV